MSRPSAQGSKAAHYRGDDDSAQAAAPVAWGAATPVVASVLLHDLASRERWDKASGNAAHVGWDRIGR
jgi:hypothetical protein